MGIGDIVKEAHTCSCMQWPTVDVNGEESVLISSSYPESSSFSAKPRPGATTSLRRVLMLWQHAGRLISPKDRFTVGQSLGICAWGRGLCYPSAPPVNLVRVCSVSCMPSAGWHLCQTHDGPRKWYGISILSSEYWVLAGPVQDSHDKGTLKSFCSNTCAATTTHPSVCVCL